MKIGIVLFLLIVVGGWLLVRQFSKPQPQFLGNSAMGFTEPENVKISPHQALELAAPHLESSYGKRLGRRGVHEPHPDREAIETMFYHKGWYIIVRDDYPFKTIKAYLYGGIGVHSETGEVRPP